MGFLVSRSSRSPFARGLAAFLVAVCVLQLGPASAAPADIFASPAPMTGADAPKAADIKDGDATVSTQTGALTWSYPITVPPGRNGMAPSIALSYSSQAPTYGGIAAGFAWNLGVPEIREDTSESRLKTHPLIAGFDDDSKDDDRFVGLAGRRLVLVHELKGTDAYAAYRAQGDDAFQRYERLSTGPPFWRVRTTDGSTMYFGGYSTGGAVGCSNVSEKYAPLAEQRDSFGNSIKYSYEERSSGECRLKRIEWGEGAGVQHFARVELEWLPEWPGGPGGGTCNGVPVGSHTDYRSGTKILTGASNLRKIRATAFPPGAPGAPVHTREITLDYSGRYMRCDQPHAPFRQLVSIQESAWMTGSPAVQLPPVTLEYGEPAVVFANSSSANRPWNTGESKPNSVAWGRRYPTPTTEQLDRTPSVEAMLVDMNGDGLLDRLFMASDGTSDGVCKAAWQENVGPPEGSTQPRFDAIHTIMLPQLKWHGPTSGSNPPPLAGGSRADASRGERCSLSGQVTAFWNSVDVPICHNGQPGGDQCRTATNEDDPSLYCDPNGRECPASQSVPRSKHTYLHYRWVDVDGDGLTDLVAAAHGDVRTYDIEQGNYTINSPPPAEPLLFGPWPECPKDVERCKDVDTGCVQSAIRSGDFAAIDKCIEMAPTFPCNEISKAPYGAPFSINRGPYTRCEGLYPWFVFKNRGDGTLNDPVIKYQPVPLESDVGDSNLGPAQGWVSQWHAILDFDGDGTLDAIAKAAYQSTPLWWVWFGDGTGGFEPKRYTFLGHIGPLSESGIVSSVSVGATAGLIDFNADGMPDYWQEIAGQGNAMVWLNNGTTHSAADYTVTPVSSVSIGSAKPGNDTSHNITDQKCTTVPGPSGTKCTYYAGTTRAQNRVFDVDNDGRLDLVKDIPNGRPWVFFNVGGQFNETPVLVNASGANIQGLKRSTAVVGAQSNPEGTWTLYNDHIDLNGDGIAEIIDFEAGTYKQATQLNKEPARLLVRVHNGRGAHTNITYASMHDKTTVKQDANRTASPFWTDRWGSEHPNASPRTQWVVRAVTTTDDFAATASTTSYFYTHPRFAPDDMGKYGLRGFAEVKTTGPSGAKTLYRYGYDVDWSGRLVETLVQPSDAESSVTNEVRSIDRVTWTRKTLFGDKIETYHITDKEGFICWNGADETACKASPAGYAKTEFEQVQLYSDLATGPALLWTNKSSTLRSATSGPYVDGDRRTTQTFRVHSDGANYRVRALAATREHLESGTWTLYGKTVQVWDPAYLVPQKSAVWLRNSTANCAVDYSNIDCAVTHFEYDLTNGNLKKRWKPKQWASNKFSEYIYDSRKLFVTTAVNELGHRVDNTYEYGTGVKLMTEGPNQRTCVTGSGCPLDATHPLKEQQKVVVDGFGRTVETWDTVSDDGTLYELVQRSITSYVDTASGSIPTSVTERVRLSTASSVWTHSRTEFDGLGRPLKETSYVQGSAPADHVTVFRYRNDGTLATVEAPDPSQNNAARVTYTYSFDSLARPTATRRPDGFDPLMDQTGVNITYDGTQTSTAEVTTAGAGGGHMAVSAVNRDGFGRVVQALELREGPAVSATTYTYGPDDNVISIVDPDGVTTTMKHDFVGQRTEIARHGRVWKYTYDKNGNLESEMVPGSPKPPVTDIDYTTTFVYDELDRPRSKDIGQRSLSAADQALFANRKETYEWDIGGNMIGHLRYWRSFGPNQNTAAIVQSTRVNNQEQPITEIQNIKIAGLPELERRFGLRYHLFGGVSETRFEDALGGTNKTIALTHYDARALPTHVVLKRGGQPDQILAMQTRNVAGLVTKRRTDTTGAMTFVESNWTYDTLGRVKSQVVQTGPGPTQVVRQELAYFGNDNPKTLTHYLGTNAKVFDFTYDRRHQLKSVSSTTPGYFDATYNYSPGGRFTRATESQTITPLPLGTDVRPRDVKYVYGDADPERVTALANASGDTTYAAYSYDAAGNMTMRCNGSTVGATCAGEFTEYVYDGQDQLRRATKIIGGVIQGSEEYWYDGEGKRIVVLKRDAAGNRSEMIWFIGEVQAHYNGDGEVVRAYSHVSLGTPIARVERISNKTTSVEYWFHGLAKNMIAAVAENGATVAGFSYAPFGEVIEATEGNGGSLSHLRRMNDKFVDAVSGLGYYGFRSYDKTLIGWTQSDPVYRFVPDAALGDPRRANLYQFSLNNPLRYLDPDGLDSTDANWGAGQFFGRCMKNEPCAADPDLVGGGWGASVGNSETSTTALRTMLGLGIVEPGKEFYEQIEESFPDFEQIEPQSRGARPIRNSGRIRGGRSGRGNRGLPGLPVRPTRGSGQRDPRNGAALPSMRPAAGGISSNYGSGAGPMTGVVFVIRNGKVINRYKAQSGNMTEAEKALGFPLGPNASHVEARASRDSKLRSGDIVVIFGQYDACTACRGAMNKAGERGIAIIYSGPTQIFNNNYARAQMRGR